MIHRFISCEPSSTTCRQCGKRKWDVTRHEFSTDELMERILAMDDAVDWAIRAIRPFAACVEQIKPEESDEEWAKFRLICGDYRRAEIVAHKLEGLNK